MIERYSREEMSQIWEDKEKYESWLDVEIAVSEAMEKKEVTPNGVSGILKKVKETERLNFDRIAEIEKKTKHDVIAFVQAVKEAVAELEGIPYLEKWVHFGITSSDIVDTAFALRLVKATNILIKGIRSLGEITKEKALEYKNLITVGRTHGIHGEPTTLGLMFLNWYAELKRDEERLLVARKEIKVGKISGAVGNYGGVSLSPLLESYALGKLGLETESCSTQVVQRDRYAVYLSTLAIVAGTIERMALQIRHLQRTEVDEINEFFDVEQKGSSVMPHKKNPIISENLCGLSRVMRSYAQASMENTALWHERDISHSSVERIIIPDATILLDYMLNRAGYIKDLIIHKNKIEENLKLNKGAIFSGNLLVSLINKGLSREEAYKMIQKAAFQTETDRGTLNTSQFRSNIRDEVLKHLSREELDHCFDIEYSVRWVDSIFKRVLGC